MLAINDLNVSLDLDKAALEAVSGAGTHYSSPITRTISSNVGAWGTTYSSLVSQNAFVHGVRHNKYFQRKYRTITYRQRKSWYKYVG